MNLINQRWTMNKDKNKKQIGSMDYRKALDEAKFEANKQGRPSKINKIDLNLLCDFLEKGLPIQDACMSVGIHPKTFRRWTLLGMQEEEQVYINFYYLTNRAMSKYKGRLIETIHEDAIINKNVKSAMWLLERYDPDNYNLTTKETVEVIPNHMLSELEVDLEVSSLPTQHKEPLQTFEEEFGKEVNL